MIREEQFCKQNVNRKSGGAGHKGGRHNRRNRTSKSQKHGEKGLSRQAHHSHGFVHNVGHTGHVAAVLQKGQRKKQDENVGEEGQNTAYSRNNAVDNQGLHPAGHVNTRQKRLGGGRKPVQPCLKITFQKIAYGKGKEEHQRHNSEENRNSQNRMCQKPVNLIGPL